MAKKNPKGTIKKVGQQLKQRTTSNVFGRLSFLRTNIIQRISSVVPAQYRWLVPFLAKELDLKTLTLEDLKKRLGKPGEEALEGEEAEAVVAEVEKEPSLEVPSDFPSILSPEWKIRGDRGTYEIESFLDQRGNGRLYQAVQLPDRQKVIIKEYLLPERYFNDQEAKERKDTFTRLAGIELADGRKHNFRVLSPWEAIADAKERRCYIIIKNNVYTAPTLGKYLQQTGALTNNQVRDILYQALQSLEFIHKQKFRLPSGLVESKLTHGNLNLESLLIVPNYQGFYIYLCDLALWEHRFNPPLSKKLNYSIAKDLKDLGYIAFYLLVGGRVDPVSKQPFDPRINKEWPSTVNSELKQFILNLMGLGLTSFKSAEAALQYLLKLYLDIEKEQPSPTPTPGEEEEKKKQGFRFPLWLLASLGVLFLGLLIWFLAIRNRERTLAFQSTKCCVEEVSGIPSGKFTYTAEATGLWRYVLTQKNLLIQGVTLEQELQQNVPQLELNYLPESSLTQAISLLKKEKADFAITTIVDDLNPELKYQEFAYDGLTVFVAFSYARRNNSLPQKLKGQISFEQLRQLYTGKITNWKELGGPNLEVKLYIPTNEEAIKFFEQKVLKEETAINSFRRLISQNNQQDDSFIDESVVEIKRLNTFPTLRAIIEDFENEDPPFGSIGFDSFSKVFGQCSVYPLALIDDNNSLVSPLIQNNKQSVTPKIDLCNDKGSYHPNTQAFITQKYPLAYPLAVLYPRDNRKEPIGEKFAEILKTNEFQRLLQETGLIPLQPLQE